MQADAHPSRAQFAGFELDCRSSELIRHGRRIRLQGQPFRVLTLLLENAGEVVTREQLRRLLWPQETFVDFDHGLNKAIAKLRDVLDDSEAERSMIETLRRRGYRFVPAVQWAGPESEPETASVTPVTPAVEAPAEPPFAAVPGMAASYRRSLALRWGLAFSLLAGVLLGGGVALRSSLHDPPTVRSLAVLPLKNLSNDPDQEYFADGMTDELITDLSHIRSLRVISHASVTQLKSTTLSLPEIADRLHVDALVEGTILRSAGRVRITVQLVAAHPEQHLWAASFERTLGDAVTLQNDIATAAAAQIRAEITPTERAQLALSSPGNPEALDECLRGRFLLEQEEPEQTLKAVQHLQRAVQLAPRYADAYALYSEAIAYEGIYGQERNRVVAPQVTAYARQALAIDPQSAEAYKALGLGFTLNRQFGLAETAYRHSLELNPNGTRAAEELAILLDMLHRGDEAVAVMKASAEANPVAVRTQRMYANVLFRARHFNEAIAQSHRVLELDPERKGAYFILGNALAAEGRYAEAEAAFRNTTWAPDSFEWLAALRGDRAEARRLLQLPQPPDSTFQTVTLYLLGDREAALKQLDQLTNEDWDIRTYFLNCDAVFDPMRNDPGFAAILRKSGLPE